MVVEYKLNYFNIRARGEVIRLIFAAADKKYIDNRFEFEQWPEYKKKAPLGACPWLEIHDEGHVTYLGQSIAIARYLAKKFSLAGKTEIEKAEVEMYGDQITDLQNAVISATSIFTPNDDRKKYLNAKLFNETLPNNLRLFEERIKKSGSGFLAASGLTWADLHLINVLEWLGDKKEKALENFRLVRALDNKVRSIPNIAAWIAKRPKSQF